MLGYSLHYGGWWWICFGCRWVVVDGGWYILAGGRWWWLVVNIFWLVEGRSGFILAVLGWYWVVLGGGMVQSNPYIHFKVLINLLIYQVNRVDKVQACIICKMVCFGTFYCRGRPLIYVRNKWRPKPLAKTICLGVLLAITDTESKAVIR